MINLRQGSLIASLALLIACGTAAPKPPTGVVPAHVPDAVPEAQLAFEEGMRQFALGPENFTAARASLTRAVSLDKNLFEAWHNLGVIAAHQGQWVQAAQAFEHALDVQPASKNSLLGLGQAYTQQRKLEKAHKLFKSWLKAAPADREVRFAYIASLRDAGNGVAALDECRALLAKDSHDAEAFNALGLTYRHMGRLRLAETAFRRALELQPKSAHVWNNLGLLALDEGDDPAAFAAFQKAIDIDAAYAISLLNQAVVYLDSGAYDKALPVLQQAAKARPNDADIHVALGVAFRGAGQFEKASEHYEQALNLHPDYPPALYNLGVLYMDHKEDAQKAKAALTSFAKVAPDKDPKQSDVKMRLRMLR